MISSVQVILFLLWSYFLTPPKLLFCSWIPLRSSVVSADTIKLVRSAICCYQLLNFRISYMNALKKLPITSLMSRQRWQITSSSSAVDSGVPQGSVVGPASFLSFINDLPDVALSKIYMFAYDTKMYREIKDSTDQNSLQSDVNNLVHWSTTWQVGTYCSIQQNVSIFLLVIHAILQITKWHSLMEKFLILRRAPSKGIWESWSTLVWHFQST